MAISTANLIAAWRFERGNSADSAAHDYDLTNHNSYTYASGKVGNGISLNGTNQYGTAAHAAGQNATSWTISAWIKPTDFAAYYIIASKSDADDKRNYALYVNITDGKIVASFTQGVATYRGSTSSTGVTAGVWSHVAGTYNASTGDLKVYINGAQNGAGDTFTGSPDTVAQPINVGSLFDGSTPFKGMLDEVFIWGRDLDATEISALYNSGSGAAAFDGHTTQTERYVASTGNDSNIGSSGSPWLTLAKAQDWLNLSALPDDTLYIADELTGNLRVINNSGTSGHPIRIDNSGSAQINCGNSYGISRQNCSYVEVDDIAVIGSGVSSSGETSSVSAGILVHLKYDGADIVGCHTENSLVQGCFYGIQRRVEWYTSTNDIVNCDTGNCETSENGFAGIWDWHVPTPGTPDTPTHDQRITDCTISGHNSNLNYGVDEDSINNQGDYEHALASGFIWSGFGIGVANGEDCLIDGVLCHHNGEGSNPDGVGGPTGILFVECVDCVAQDFEVHHQYSPEGVDGEGIDFDGGCIRCIAQRGWVHDCDGAAMMDFQIAGYTQNQDNVFRFMATQNNGRRSLKAGSYPPTSASFFCVPPSGGSPAVALGTLVYNCTDFTARALSPDSVVKSFVIGEGSDASIRNCILINNGGGMKFGDMPDTAKLQGNRYYNFNSSTFNVNVEAVDKSSLGSLQALGDGFEKIGSTTVGSTGDPVLSDIGNGGSYGVGLANSSLVAYDPAGGSPVVGAGLDLNDEFGTDIGTLDFHGNTNEPGSGFSIGAVASNAGFAASPASIPKNHANNITITLSGTGTAWDGTTVFTPSGVAGVNKVSQNVASSTSATLVVTTGSTAGTLTITESVTGSSTANVTVATATLTITPTSGLLGATPLLTLVGANTVWSQETPATLFSISGGSGASLGTPTITTNVDGTMVLTGGCGTGTLTITDTSTGATDTVAVAAATSYSVSPSGTVNGVLNAPTSFSFRANGLSSAAVTPATAGTGSWAVGDVTLNGTTAVQKTYTGTTLNAADTLSFTNDGGLTDQGDITFNVRAAGNNNSLTVRLSQLGL